MSEARVLPAWAEDLRRRYLRGEASMFVLHGNVYDVVLCSKKMMALTEFRGSGDGNLLVFHRDGAALKR